MEVYVAFEYSDGARTSLKAYTSEEDAKRFCTEHPPVPDTIFWYDKVEVEGSLVEPPKKIDMVTDRKTHQLIGIFDDKHSDRFFTGVDVRVGDHVIKGGIKASKNEYTIWTLAFNTEFPDSRIKVSKAKASAKKRDSDASY